MNLESPKEEPKQEPTTGEPRYGGFWIRFLAAILDGIVLSIVLTPLYVLLGWWLFKSVSGVISGIPTSPTAEEITRVQGQIGTSLLGLTAKTTGFSFLGTLISWAYYVIFTGAWGATLGKMALGVKVVNRDLQKIGYGTAFLREVIGKIVSSLIFLLGFLWIAFDPKKQGWHDKIAGTYVIKSR